MNNLHPVFAGILSTMSQIPAQISRAEYISRLARMDWDFEWSDDGSVYRRGREELQSLRKVQADIDPTGELWNKHAPKQYRAEVQQ